MSSPEVLPFRPRAAAASRPPVAILSDFIYDRPSTTPLRQSTFHLRILLLICKNTYAFRAALGAARAAASPGGGPQNPAGAGRAPQAAVREITRPCSQQSAGRISSVVRKLFDMTFHFSPLTFHFVSVFRLGKIKLALASALDFSYSGWRRRYSVSAKSS